MAKRTDADTLTDIFEVDASANAIEFWSDWSHDLYEKARQRASAHPAESTSVIIETLLTAHGIAAQDPTAEVIQGGETRIQHEASVGEGVEETRYGRRAVELAAELGIDLTVTGRDNATFETFGTTYDSAGGESRSI